MPAKRILSQVLPVNALTFAVGLADLLTTVFWLKAGRIIEVNPIMASVLKAGLAPFILVKMSTLVTYVGVMEWYRRRRNPAFARLMGNVALFGYLGIYTISFCCVNFS